MSGDNSQIGSVASKCLLHVFLGVLEGEVGIECLLRDHERPLSSEHGVAHGPQVQHLQQLVQRQVRGLPQREALSEST